MRVLIVNQFFEPDPAATAQAAAHLGRRLIERGHEVDVLASRYSHILEGKTLPGIEEIDGMRVRRVGGTNFGRSNLAGRIIDTATFYVALASRAVFSRRPDAFLVMSSPPMIETVAPAVRFLRRTWSGCWLMDMNPDITVEMGVLSRRNPLMWCCRFLGVHAMRHMSRVIAIGPCMAGRVAERGVRRERISFVETGCDPDEMPPMEHARNQWREEQGIDVERVVFMYSGNMGIGHPLEDFLEAYDTLASGEADPGFDLYMIGGGNRKREVEQFIESEKPDHLLLLPYQPFDVLNQSLSAGDVHLISQASNMTGAFIPSKVYGIMSVGRPFIFVGPEDATVGRIANEGPCGIVVPPGDIESLCSAFTRLREDAALRRELGANGRRLVETKYARKACEDRLIDILEADAGSR